MINNKPNTSLSAEEIKRLQEFKQIADTVHLRFIEETFLSNTSSLLDLETLIKTSPAYLQVVKEYPELTFVSVLILIEMIYSRSKNKAFLNTNITAESLIKEALEMYIYGKNV